MKNKKLEKQVSIVLGIVCFMLTIGICIQVKSVDTIT